MTMMKYAKLTEDLKTCTKCEKVAYATRKEAYRGGASRGEFRRAYLGGCGWWHMTKLKDWERK